ncbi:MAG: glycosyltransferase, partial [bacterium]
MTAARRVLLISPQPFFAWRGSSIRVKFNVQALADLGYQVDLLTIPVGEEEPSTPARVIRVWNLFGSTKISIGPSPLKMWFDLLLFIRGLGLVFSARYDVVHGTEEAGFIAWILSRIARGAAVYEKHSDAASYKKGAIQNLILKLYLWVEHFTCRHADLVICTGPGLYKQAKSVAPNALIRDICDIPSSLVEPTDEDTLIARRELNQGEDKIL